MPNRLIGETSPYLLQHAHNPVDWYPWGEEALAKALGEDKPILLSIGYSACHWCHVMERESFEDEATAALMNRSFVNIKVDREERPDLDEVYMAAVQGLTGHGGWPMTVFLTPQGKPFYGGTYFPPSDRMGMPSFQRVLLSVAQSYREQRDQVYQHADRVSSYIQQQTLSGPPAGQLDSTVLDQAFSSLARQFDPTHGGFGRAPKFPQAMALEYLLRYHRRTGNAQALLMAETSLQRMACGGICDQIGGGFHRYSVDDRWLVPHFEKMLYDNALLGRVYLHAYQITGSPLYQRVVEETLEYVRREMTDPAGGFYCTQDADSEGEEGTYYLWTPGLIEAVLGKADAPAVCAYYGVTERGNFEGRTILTFPADSEVVAREQGMGLPDLENLVAEARPRLLEARQQRVPPARDDKILAAWNGLMLHTFADAYRALGRPAYRATAEANAGFLLRELWRDGRLYRVHKDGHTKIPGYLEDYAGLADGLLALYEATFQPGWFAAARAIAATMTDLFWDETSGSLSDTARDAEALVARPRERWDNATPSGASLACHVLLRLWALTGDTSAEAIARTVLASTVDLMGEHAVGLGNILGALDFYLAPPYEIAVVGDPQLPETARLLEPLQREYLPHVALACGPPGHTEEADTVPLLANRQLVDGHPAAYVCQGFVCDLPTTDPDQLRQQLGIRSRQPRDG